MIAAGERAATEIYDAEQRRLVASLPGGPRTRGPTGWLGLPLAGRFGRGLHQHLGRLHPGLDIGGRTGEPIHAAAAGRVVFADELGGYGNLVCLDHGHGVATCYAHRLGLERPVGAVVQAGEVIGYVGSSGRSSGPHLHFEIRADGAPLEPRDLLLLHGTSSMPDEPWQPAVQGDAADCAADAIDEIAQRLERLLDEPLGSPALADGSAGVALLFSTLARAGDGERHARTARALLEHSVDALARVRLDASLHDGVTGIAWTAAQLEGVPADPRRDRWRQVDVVLGDYAGALRPPPDPGSADVVAAIGLYALERLPRAQAWDSLERVLDHLEDVGREPADVHSLGRLAVLAAACETPSVVRARKLLEGSGPVVAELVANGSPTTAAALVPVARAAGRPSWERWAVELACEAASAGTRGIDDSSLSGGAAGHTLAFAAMFNLTGVELFRAAASASAERTVELWRRRLDGEPEHGFLHGSAGVALALLAAIGDLRPTWAGALCLAPARRGQGGSPLVAGQG